MLLLILVSDGTVHAQEADHPTKVIAAIPENFPPTYYRDPITGKPAGFSVELMNAIAQRAGITVEYVFAPAWDGVHQLVVDGKADLIPNLLINADRSRQFLFTSPVEITEVNFIIRSSDAAVAPSARTIIGVMKSSSAEAYLRAQKIGIINTYNNLDELLIALLSGRIDMLLAPTPNVLKLARESGIEDKIKVIQPSAFDGKRAIAIRKDRSALRDQLDKEITSFIKTPEYQDLYDKWWGKERTWWTVRKSVFLFSLSLFVVAGGLLLWRHRSVLFLSSVIREQKEELEQYFNSALDLLCVANIDGTFRRLNPEWSRVLGYSLTEMIGRSFYDFVHPDDLEHTRNAAEMLANNQAINSFVNRYRHNNGSYRWIEWRAYPHESVMYAVARDITDKKIAEDEKALRLQQLQMAHDVLQRQEEWVRATLNSIGDAVIVTDKHCRVVKINPVAEKLIGWSNNEAQGVELLEVFHIVNAMTRLPVENPASRVLETGEIVGLANHTVLISRSGQEYQIADSGAPVRHADGSVDGVVLVFRDVTEEYAMQERLHQSQKMDAIGQLAGGIAHDFNNMLAGIIGAAEIMADKVTMDHQLAECVRIIIASAEQAAGLTRKLLSFSRSSSMELSPIDIHQVINNAVGMLQKTIDRRVRIEVHFNASSSIIIGESSALQNIFLNLGINASHALPQGGVIQITTTLVDITHAYCKASSFDLVPGVYLGVEFRDNGTGIAPNSLPHVFEPFYTTKEKGKGTGLGLSVVHGTVCQHKGAITVYSELGKGTSFHLLFPLAKEQAIPLVEEMAPIKGHGKILVVDDEDSMRATVKALLEELGYEVVLAENGQQAVSIFEAIWQTVDLVLLDMIMPQMNGRDCFLALHRINPTVKVILSSGFSREEDVEEMKELGLCGFLRKPYRIGLLSTTISQMIGRPKDRH